MYASFCIYCEMHNPKDTYHRSAAAFKNHRKWSIRLKIVVQTSIASHSFGCRSAFCHSIRWHNRLLPATHWRAYLPGVPPRSSMQWLMPFKESHCECGEDFVAVVFFWMSVGVFVFCAVSKKTLQIFWDQPLSRRFANCFSKSNSFFLKGGKIRKWEQQPYGNPQNLMGGPPTPVFWRCQVSGQK